MNLTTSMLDDDDDDRMSTNENQTDADDHDNGAFLGVLKSFYFLAQMHLSYRLLFLLCIR